MFGRGRGTRAGAEVSCQVPGCSEDVPVKSYYRRCKICPHHMNLPVFVMDGKSMRFCKLCRRFEDVLLFDGSMKSCRESLNRHNARRRQKRHGSAAGGGASPESSEDRPSSPRFISSDATAGERGAERSRGGRSRAAQASRPLAIAAAAAINSSLPSEAGERQGAKSAGGQQGAAVPSSSAAQQLLPWWHLATAAAAEASANEGSEGLLPRLAPVRGSTGGAGGSSARAGAGPPAAAGSNILADLPLLLASTGAQDGNALLAGISEMLEGASGGRQGVLMQQPTGAEGEEEQEQGPPQQRRRLETDIGAARSAFSPVGEGVAGRPPPGDAGGREGDRWAGNDEVPAAMDTPAKLASLTLGDISAMLTSVGAREMRDWLLDGMACAPQRKQAQGRGQWQKPTQKQLQAGDGSGAQAGPASQGGPAPANDLAWEAPTGADGRVAPGHGALEAFDTSMKLNSLTLGELSMLMTSLGAKEMQDWLPGLLEGMSSWQQLQGEGGGMGQIPGSPEQPLHLSSRTSMETSDQLAAAGSGAAGDELQQLQPSQGAALLPSMPLPSTLKRRSLVLRPVGSGSSAGSDWGGGGRPPSTGQEQQQRQEEALGPQAAASPWAAAALLGAAPTASPEKGGED